MKRCLPYLSVLLLMCSVTFGQPAEQSEEAKSWGKAYFAPVIGVHGGNSEALFTTGGTYEGLLADNLGVALDLAYLAPFDSTSSGIGTFSPGLLYQFGRSKTRPFVTGGYTLFFREGTANGGYFGGGINHWAGSSLGFGIEARDMIGVGNVHFIQLRVSVLFR